MEEFTESQLHQAWEDYASRKKSEGKDSEYHILQQEYSLTDDWTIELKLVNKLQGDMFDKLRADLMLHLRRTLKNDRLSIKVIFEEMKIEKMLYTNREKLDYLQERKPALKLLRDRLGLDPDF